MSDILATFTILLAVFTYLESLYKDKIDKSLSVYVNKDHPRDNKSNYELVKKTITNYQLMLLIISVVITIIMIPVSKEILSSSMALIIEGIAKYDICATTVVLLNIAFLGITVKQIYLTCKLIRKLKALKYD